MMSQKKGKNTSKDMQTEELKDILSDMDDDSSPYLSPEVSVVKKPSFLRGGSVAEEPKEQEQISMGSDVLQEGIPQAPPQSHIEGTKAHQIETEPIKPAVIPPQPQAPPQTTQAIPIQPPKDVWEELVGSEVPNGEFFHDLSIFFAQLGRSFTERYDYWEETTNIIIKILTKMNQTMETNTENMIEVLENLFEKMIMGMQDFKKKQSEVERFSDINYKQVAAQFKKTLELLNFQIREFKLQRMVDNIYNIYLN